MSKTVWLVTLGGNSFSEYCVRAIFSDEADANRYAELFGGDTEERTMDEPIPEPHEWAGYYDFLKDELTVRQIPVSVPHKKNAEAMVARFTDPERTPNWLMHIEATGKTEEEARSSVLELRDLIIRMRDGI